MRLIFSIFLYLPQIFYARKFFEILPKFSKDFMAPNPLPIFGSASRQEKIEILKLSAKTDLIVNWNGQNPFLEEFVLVLLTDNELTPNENISINQQIYFLTSSLEVFEQYIINEHTILKKMGHYSNNTYVPQKVASWGY
jgi:hypothetical protein